MHQSSLSSITPAHKYHPSCHVSVISCLEVSVYRWVSCVCDRDMRLATFKQKGMTYVSQLALENVKALKAIIQWNHEHGIRFFRWHYLYCPVLLAHEHLYVQTVPGFSVRHIMFLFLA